jgi:hypothetical protein
LHLGGGTFLASSLFPLPPIPAPLLLTSCLFIQYHCTVHHTTLRHFMFSGFSSEWPLDVWRVSVFLSFCRLLCMALACGLVFVVGGPEWLPTIKMRRLHVYSTTLSGLSVFVTSCRNMCLRHIHATQNQPFTRTHDYADMLGCARRCRLLHCPHNSQWYSTRAVVEIRRWPGICRA